MERIGKIYKIVNSVNDKIYVGSTQLQYLSKRMGHHRENCLKLSNNLCGKLYPAMMEYGVDKFKIILLETILFTDKEQLKSKEYDWIVKLDSVNNGYNTIYKDGKLPQESLNKLKKGLVKYYRETNKDVGLYYIEESIGKPRWICKWTENGKLNSKSFSVSDISKTDKIKEMAKQYRAEKISGLELYN